MRGNSRISSATVTIPPKVGPWKGPGTPGTPGSWDWNGWWVVGIYPVLHIYMCVCAYIYIYYMWVCMCVCAGYIHINIYIHRVCILYIYISLSLSVDMDEYHHFCVIIAAVRVCSCLFNSGVDQTAICNGPMITHEISRLICCSQLDGWYHRNSWGFSSPYVSIYNMQWMPSFRAMLFPFHTG